jgi:nucleoside-diphosphate-sugar epimerase
MTRVLVTGASGFIGLHALGPLQKRGFEVHAVARRAPTGEAGAIRWHRADLMAASEREGLLAEVRPTHLLHLAWYAEHGKYWTSAENLRWVEASLALLRGFGDNGGRRAVVAGTCAEYDWRHGYCVEGITPTVPKTLYGAAKHALHGVAVAYARQAGIGLAWGRVFFPYGPGEAPARLVPSTIAALLAKQPVRCTHGAQYRDFLHVTDCADALAALAASEVEGAVNIGSGEPHTIREVVETLAAIADPQRKAAIEFGAVAVADDDPPLLVADTSRLRGELHWQPSIPLAQGLAAAVEDARRALPAG